VACLDDCGDVFGDEVLVLHRCDGMVHAHHRTDLVYPVTTSIYDDICIYAALVCFNRPSVIGVLGQASDGGVAVHLCPGLACMICQGLTELRRIDVTVLAIPQTADEVVGGNQRVPAGAFCGVDHFKIDAHTLGHA